MFYFYYETIGAEQLGKMNYYTHWVEEHRGYKKAIEEASDHFEEHWSTHQTIIDEKNKRLYTLNGKVKINPEYYELESEEYEVYNTNFFNRRLKPTLVGIYKKNLNKGNKNEC